MTVAIASAASTAEPLILRDELADPARARAPAAATARSPGAPNHSPSNRYVLHQFFADGSCGGTLGEVHSALIPVERVPEHLIAAMQRDNGAVVSDGDEFSQELDDFVSSCEDCEIHGPVTLPEGAVIVALCQTF